MHYVLTLFAMFLTHFAGGWVVVSSGDTWRTENAPVIAWGV